MQTQHLPPLNANPILTLGDLGLDRSVGLDQASRGLAERSEAQVLRWIQFPAGALFFTLVPGDPESGAIYVFDRKDGVFYYVEFKLRQAVAAPFLVIEVHVIEHPVLPVEHVDGTRFRIAGDQGEEQRARRKLNPAEDLGF